MKKMISFLTILIIVLSITSFVSARRNKKLRACLKKAKIVYKRSAKKCKKMSNIRNKRMCLMGAAQNYMQARAKCSQLQR